MHPPAVVLVFLFTMPCCLSLAADPTPGAPVAPLAPRREHLQNWHGRTFPDPYYWLRDKESPEVRSYLEAENAYTAAMTAEQKPFTEALYREMLGRLKQTDLDAPVRLGHYHYYIRTEEGLQYPIRCRKRSGDQGTWNPTATEEVLLDQNAMAQGLHFLAIGDYEVSDSEDLLLYTTDTTGFRQYQLFIKNLKSGRVEGPLAERVTSATWAADNETIFFTTEHPVTKRSDTVWKLRRGSAPRQVTAESDELFNVGVWKSRDRQFVGISFRSTDTWDHWLLASTNVEGRFKPVLPRTKGHKYDLDHRTGTLFLRTNRDAKNFRLVEAPLSDPDPAHWKTVIEHRPDVLLEEVQVFRDHLAVQEKQAGLNRIRVRPIQGGPWKDIVFAEPVYSASLGATPDFNSSRLRYDYESLISPRGILDFDMNTGESVLLKRQEVLGGYDPGRYVSERLWATARDGTRVPISLVRPRGLPREGSAPLWLYGYGSYGLGTPATFDLARVSLLDRGVAYAIAHIRGGDELGEPWHDDGMLMKKRNTFHDFVDCAEFLVREKWTRPEKLMIEGYSAGGLLIGAVLNERPDLFAAAHVGVPFVDVMNTMMDATLPLTVGEYLEWGNPNEREAFDYMLSYSPYDNLARRAYPAILVTTSFNDSQVMYWEPAKYVAKLRTLKTDGNPLLLKTKMDPAGHGGASGRYDALRDSAFEMAWMLSQVGITR